MGVYIKGLDMPRCCRVCPFSHIWEYDDETSCILGGCWHPRSSNKRHKDCPLVEVKTPHGRLGDLDSLKSNLIHDYAYAAAKMVDDEPIIIEAEGKDDG